MSGKHARILVVENEPQILFNLQQILEFSDYQVFTASDGQEGLDLACSVVPDLVVSDVMMPELDGYSLVTQLRQEVATANIPVILLTAKSEYKDLRHGMELGADDYLTKPFEPQDLLNAVASRLEKKAQLDLQFGQIRDQTTSLRQKIEAYQQQDQEHQDLAEIRDELLAKLLQDLSEPITNISLAVRMAQGATSPSQRSRYLKVLQEECDRERQILQEISDLRALLTPANTALLSRFKLLRKSD
jgi:DNA-binding response OmpR family regulator